MGQDEDQGQLGAWYVMASMGLFDVQGHTSSNPSLQFGSPLFDKITIKLDPTYYKGKEFVIETVNQSSENHYIQSVLWNGNPINNNWMYRDELMQGGKLIFTLGANPNKKWGIEKAPPSMTNEE